MFVPMEIGQTSNAFLLLGTNLGDRLANLAHARDAIAQRVGKLLRSSAVYKTAPWGDADQPDFFNQVIHTETVLNPAEVLDRVLAIEKEMGRSREKKWGPRLIDIDILFYDEQIIQSPTLIIPHPSIQSRRFTLVPLSEIAANMVHPLLKKDMRTLLAECADTLEVIKV